MYFYRGLVPLLLKKSDPWQFAKPYGKSSLRTFTGFADDASKSRSTIVTTWNSYGGLHKAAWLVGLVGVLIFIPLTIVARFVHSQRGDTYKSRGLRPIEQAFFDRRSQMLASVRNSRPDQAPEFP